MGLDSGAASDSPTDGELLRVAGGCVHPPLRLSGLIYYSGCCVHCPLRDNIDIWPVMWYDLCRYLLLKRGVVFENGKGYCASL